MFSLFNMFGRSAALNAFEDALQASGVHPLLVPEAVKLTVVRLCKQDGFGEAARLLAYCMLGREQFMESNSFHARELVEQRVEAAIDAGDSVDAKLILLALHSGLMDQEIADEIEVEDC